MATMKKAQSGVVVSRKDEKANPNDFKYLRKSEKAASDKAIKSKVKPKEMMKKALYPAAKKKTGMDAVKAVGKYVSTFGGATERDNPKQKDINIVKKLKETGTKVKNKLGLKSGGSVKKCKYGCN